MGIFTTNGETAPAAGRDASRNETASISNQLAEQLSALEVPVFLLLGLMRS
jgi:hypothetical protein